MDFDPITGNLWDTENGVVFGDEINLIHPGFNSGWNKIDGIWLRGYAIENTEAHVASNQTIDELLVNFNGKANTVHLNLHGLMMLGLLRLGSLILTS
jgi:hypothetical protein